MKIWDSVAVAAVLAAAPLAAQSTNDATPPATATPVPTPTPAPAPAGNSVGPPQLRDFNLDGRVTQPAQPATPTPTPTPTPIPTPIPTPVSRAPAPNNATPRAIPAPVDAAPGPRVAAPDRNPAPDAVTIDLPPTEAAPLAPDTALGPVPDPIPSATPPIAEAPGTAWWPWLAALVALALGAGLLWWRRQQRSAARYATDHAELGALVAAPDAAPVLPRAAATPPRQAPRVQAQTPAGPVPIPVSAPVSAPIPDGIVSTRLKPRLTFELVPIRTETDVAEGAAVTFDLIVTNQGSAPARDVLIEAKLVNAGPQVDAEVGRFFMQPAGTGDRLPMIAPMGRVSLKMRVAASAPNLAPLVVEGRKLLVPMVAINAAYRWSGGELTDSSSFLVGRGETEGKMAPFRLDLGARSWSGLGARVHSSGLQR